MSWISEHKNLWRVAVLILVVVAISGPWTYTADGVGPVEWCDAPNILLENGHCVRLVSGADVLTFMAGAFLELSVGLVTGEIVHAGRFREFLLTFLFMVGIILLVLPFFSMLLLTILGKGRRRLRVFQVVAWGLADLLPLLLIVSVTSELYPALWGTWLYIALTSVALTLEMLALIRERSRPEMGGP